MKSGTKPESIPLTYRTVSTDRPKNRLRAKILSPLVCSVGASIGIFGGISALFVGLVCVVIHAAVAGDIIFDRAGTTFLIVAIPAILIGSIFLDEIDHKDQ
jgi:hypothetical protein